MMAYPSHLSDDELEALPVGPHVRRQRKATAEDWKNGLYGQWIEWDEARPGIASARQIGEPVFWRDSSGQRWTFDQWDDGGWFKMMFQLG